MTTCSDLASRLGEPTAGSASTISSWVLLEHDGPWGADTREEVFAATLGEQRWAELTDIWMARQLRPLLVRRPSRHSESRRGRRRDDPRDAQVIVGAAAGDGFLEVTDVAGLLDLDLDALADGRPGHGAPLAGPIFLICTNGAVDRCCATDGRRLADALSAGHPDLVWESTHLGGCRFAANLLTLPSGHMHGRLTPKDGSRVVREALSGRVASTGWRGRTTESSWSALAIEHVRARLGLTDPTALRVREEQLHTDTVVGEDGDEPAGCDVVVDHDGSAWRVVLRTHTLAPRTSLCDGEGELYPSPVVTGAARCGPGPQSALTSVVPITP